MQSSSDKTGEYCKKCWGSCCLFLILGFAIQTFIVPNFIRKKIMEGIEDGLIITEVDEDDDNYKSWYSNTEPDDMIISFEQYFFNVTNPAEVAKGELPQLDFVGPFVYNKYSTKYDPQFSDDKNLVQFVDWSYYIYNETRTPDHLDENDIIYIYNPILFPLALMFDAQAATQPFLVKQLMKALNAYLLEESDLFLTGSAHDLTFGTTVPLLEKMLADATLAALLAQAGIDTAEFNLFTNSSTGEDAKEAWGYDTKYTGNNDSKLTGRYYKYEGMETIDYFAESFSIAPAYLDIYGIDNIKKENNLLVWVSDVFRNAVFEFEKEVDHHGVTLWRYALQGSPQLDNAEQVPENAKWYQFGPRGVVNLTSCPPYFPFFAGKPLFKDSGYEDLTKLYGLPDPAGWDYLDTHLDIEPITGGTFRGKKFLQASFPVFNYSGFDIMANLYGGSPLLYPTYATKETANISKSSCDDFVNLVYGGYKVADVLFWVGITCWILLGIICCVMAICYVLFSDDPYAPGQGAYTPIKESFSHKNSTTQNSYPEVGLVK